MKRPHTGFTKPLHPPVESAPSPGHWRLLPSDGFGSETCHSMIDTANGSNGSTAQIPLTHHVSVFSTTDCERMGQWVEEADSPTRNDGK